LSYIDIAIRTHQHSWLRRIADRESLSVAGVFRLLIESYADRITGRAPTKEIMMNVGLRVQDLERLEKLAAEAGVNRSEMARRMIDESMRA
jgi:hypothetical protein